MKNPATLAEIIRQEIGASPYVIEAAFYNRQDISTAAIAVDRSFVRPTYTDYSYRWSKEDKSRYAKAVLAMMIKQA